jgi:hypothetical protein
VAFDHFSVSLGMPGFAPLKNRPEIAPCGRGSEKADGNQVGIARAFFITIGEPTVHVVRSGGVSRRIRYRRMPGSQSGAITPPIATR